MDLDRLIHPIKNFAELVDSDIEDFLRNRSFGTENLNLEFKRGFPQKQPGGKYDIKEICKYVTGFSNEEGGLVIYGVSDDIKDPNIPYPDYIKGLQNYPSLEDLSQWATERIHPLISSPSIRIFNGVAGKVVTVLKIPTGVNRPYCYHDPNSNAVTYFKKTAGGIVELNPDEIREFHRTQMLDQASRVLQAAEREGTRTPSEAIPARVKQHEKFISSKLEPTKDFGHVAIYVWPLTAVEIPIDTVTEFLNTHRHRFSESLSHFPNIEVFQDGVSVGYFPRAIRQDINSTVRFTFYRDGFIAFDALVDTFLEGNRALNPTWLVYEIQRHLQLAKALLTKVSVKRVRVYINFKDIQGFNMAMDSPLSRVTSKYAGQHKPIFRDVDLNNLYDFDGTDRNTAMPVVREISDEVARIFGLSRALSGLWDSAGKLTYVKGLENKR